MFSIFLDHCAPACEVGLVAIDAQLAADHAVEPVFMQHERRLI